MRKLNNRLVRVAASLLLFLSVFMVSWASVQADDGVAVAGTRSASDVALAYSNAATKLSRVSALDQLRVLDGTIAAGLSLSGLNTVQNADNSVTLTGTLEGAKFLVRYPANWNGQMVLYAHGYVFPGLPDGLEPQAEPFGILTTAYQQGFAYGYSAYTKIAYAVKSGIESTQLLKRLSDAAMGVKRTYIVGISMGGNITSGLVEYYPNDYAGALPLCGVMGGWYEEIRYLYDFRVVYDYFTKPLGAPFVLPGAGQAAVPNFDLTLQKVITSVGALFTQAASDPKLAAIIGQIARVTGANPDPISFITALGSGPETTVDYLTVAGGNGYSNIDKVYQGSGDDAALNAGVERIAANPQATAYLNRWQTPSGRFSARMLSIHNLIDPLVPYQHQPIFKARVVAAGNTANLVQQVVDPKPVNLQDLSRSGPGHCFFTPSQMAFAWNSLRGWVENGTRPPDDINITAR